MKIVILFFSMTFPLKMKIYFEFSKNLKAVGMVAMGTQNLGLSLVSIKVKKKEKKKYKTQTKPAIHMCLQRTTICICHHPFLSLVIIVQERPLAFRLNGIHISQHHNAK